jgi:hypothetical protein
VACFFKNKTDNSSFYSKEIAIMGKKFENVESFKYLRSLVTDLNEMEIELKSRLAAGNKSYHALGPIFKKKGLYPSQNLSLQNSYKINSDIWSRGMDL